MRSLTGTGALMRLILRRDRLVLPIWIVLVGLVPIAIASSTAALLPTAEALQAYADTANNTPATVAVLGRAYSATVGGLTAWRTGLQSSFLIVPVSILLVIRHTRAEEDAGRRELLGATVVGRNAPLAAALLVVLAANLAIAALIAGGLIGLGLPAAGSLALGLSAASAGWVFAALAGVTAQLAERTGGARGMALGMFGVLYVLRLLGDAADEQSRIAWLTWVTPVGWMRHTRAFAGERWWVFALFVALVVALSALAFALSARRDLGAGVLPPRLGPATAAPGLRSPLGLAWRLHRGTLLAWTAGAAVFGSLLGWVSQNLSAFVNAPQISAWASRMGISNEGDAFLFVVMYVLSQIITAYAIGATLEMRSEEMSGRADAVLATATSRLRWAGSHLTFAVVGPAVMLAVLGLTIGLGHGASSGDILGDVPRLLARALVTLPAVWAVGGLTAALYGLLPRLAAALSWAALAVFLVLELGWELQRVSQAVFDISPFAHVHYAVAVTAAPLLWLVGIAVALTAAGLAGLQRRDVG